METTKTKTPAEHYYISTSDHSWASFFITEKGDMFINSDWGYWACNWRSFGPDFKKWLTNISPDYLIGCLERNQVQFHGLKKKINPRQREAIAAHLIHLQFELQREKEDVKV